MLRTQSFKIEDSEGINVLLDKYPLAKGMHILVSNGHLVIPYEDGKPANNSQRICLIGEQINILSDQKEIIIQSQMSLSSIIEDRTNQLNELSANLAEVENQPNSKGKTAKIKSMEGVEKMAQAALDEDGKRYAMNENELRRLDINIAKLQERITQLENEKGS